MAELYQAVGSGDLALVEVGASCVPMIGWIPSLRLEQELLRCKANVNFKDDEDGDSPLHSAAISGDLGLAELLIAHGANVSARNDIGQA
jgi:ankyrin repeat protein